MSEHELIAKWAPTLLAPAPELGELSDAQQEFAATTPSSSGPIQPDGDDGSSVAPADPDSDSPQHTGVMVALYPDPLHAQALAVPGGEDPEEIHLTLAYLGQVGDEVDPDAENSIVAAVKAWAATQAPIDARVNGTGFFNNVQPVTYAAVDSADLPGARQNLVHHLTQAGTPPNTEHGFTPHMTLKYADMRGHNPPPLAMHFDKATVAFAGKQTHIPLIGPKPTTPVISALTLTDRPTGPDLGNLADAGGEGGNITAFETEINGRQFIVAPAQSASLREPTIDDITSDHMLYMRGKFVGAETPNRNGALWTSGDLQLARASVVNGPLNWLHEGRHIIGSLTSADFVPGVGAGKSGQGLQQAATAQPHIAATAGIWKWLWPDEAFVVNQASDLGQLWYSMECISKEVVCAGENGCGQATSYGQYMAGAACEHVTQRASVRRFKDPVFLGGAVIVPPTRPGWAEADASVLSTATALAEAAFEQAGAPDVSANDWEQLMAQLVRFART